MASHGHPWLNRLMRCAPPDVTSQSARAVRYGVLWVRVTERIAVLRSHLDRLQAQIAADLVCGSPDALVAAAERAATLATDLIDVAQLEGFAGELAVRRAEGEGAADL